MLHPMTPAQCRAARALLHLNQSELATLSGLGLSTVVDFERERRPVSQEAIALLQNALERAGILFREGAVELALLAGLSAPTGPLGKTMPIWPKNHLGGGFQGRKSEPGAPCCVGVRPISRGQLL